MGVVALLASIFAACGTGGAEPVPADAPTPMATPGLGPPRPEVARLLDHVRAISTEIGARPAGSPAYDAAAAYARDQLESWGYDVEMQPVTASRAQSMRLPEVRTLTPQRMTLPALTFSGAGPGDVTGPLVDAGAGLPGDFGPAAEGAVVLVQRGDVFFVEMARNATDAGALALLVANKEEGLFRGEIDPPSGLPVVAIDQAEGEALRALLATGPIEMSVAIRETVSTTNVIARPPGGVCRTLSGGHLDSVPWSAGAGDNASGSAVVLELARATAAAGLSGHCFALFAAEEIGLVGSRSFVSNLGLEEREELALYLNFDVAAGDGQPAAVASPELLELIQFVAGLADIDVEVRVLKEEPPRLASDHLSFIEEGLLAVMLTNPDFDEIHVPEDTFENLEPGAIEPIAELGFALLLDFGDGAPGAALPTALP